MLAAFIEVWLAREGHDRPVGINLLTKVQAPNLATPYGAMLAGVHYVLMGAGIPREIPGVLDALAAHQSAAMRFDVDGADAGENEGLASTGRVDGFVVEGPTAGGHNAPPRGAARLNERGEPAYGERDAVDLGKMRELGLPFWLAGSIEIDGIPFQDERRRRVCDLGYLHGAYRTAVIAYLRQGLEPVVAEN